MVFFLVSDAYFRFSEVKSRLDLQHLRPLQGLPKGNTQCFPNHYFLGEEGVLCGRLAKILESIPPIIQQRRFLTFDSDH